MPKSPPRTAHPRKRQDANRKKTLLLDQDLLDRARRALGARTETDTVTQALEAVVRREMQAQGIQLLPQLGPIDASRIG